MLSVHRDGSVRHVVVPTTKSEMVSQLACGPVEDDSAEVGSRVVEGLVVDVDVPGVAVVSAELLLLPGPDVGPAVAPEVLPVASAPSVSPLPPSSPQATTTRAVSPSDSENPVPLPPSMRAPYLGL